MTHFGFSPIKCQPLKNQKIIFYSLNTVSQNVWVLYTVQNNAKIFVQIFVKSIRNLFRFMTFFRKSCWDSRFSKVCWEKRCHKADEILDKDVQKEFLTAKSFFRLKENLMGCFFNHLRQQAREWSWIPDPHSGTWLCPNKINPHQIPFNALIVGPTNSGKRNTWLIFWAVNSEENTIMWFFSVQHSHSTRRTKVSPRKT